MLDKANILQQEALGVLGVNIIYGAYAFADNLEQFILSLLDSLNPWRIEVEAIHFEGAAFENIDTRLLNVRLIQHRLSSAVLFGSNDRVLHVSEDLRKKPLLVQRGSFRPITHVNIDMMEAANAQFVSDHNLKHDAPVEVFEMTLKNLLSHDLADDETILGIISSLTALGRPVLLTDYPEFFRLTTFLRQFTNQPIGIVAGINNLYNLFNESYYEHLDGGILEAFGRLFRQRMSIYAYPTARDIFISFLDSRGELLPEIYIPKGEIITADTLHVAHELRLLYRYLCERNFIRPVQQFRAEHLQNHSSAVRKQLQAGDVSWKEAVPEAAALVIERLGLFSAPTSQH